jgi:hypothetical protein
MEKLPLSVSHSSVGTGDDAGGPGREVLVGARSVGASAHVATTSSSTCTESDATPPSPAVQNQPAAVPSMKGEMYAPSPPSNSLSLK